MFEGFVNALIESENFIRVNSSFIDILKVASGFFDTLLPVVFRVMATGEECRYRC
jgi:hypothetical protein